MSIMEIKQVGYSYDNKKKVLKGVNAEMEQGKLYAILGPSGCGKTTLLSLIGGLDSPGSGQIYFDGQDIAKTFTSMGRTLPRRGFPTIEKIMWRLSSKRTTSSTT